jgi:hypothetical protein
MGCSLDKGLFIGTELKVRTNFKEHNVNFLSLSRLVVCRKEMGNLRCMALSAKTKVRPLQYMQFAVDEFCSISSKFLKGFEIIRRN